MSRRRLNDGREFRIVKVFYYKADELIQRLEALGWDMCIGEMTSYFVYGYGQKAKRNRG